MIDAEYEELDEGAGELGDELDLASTDNLPWLESDEDDEDALRRCLQYLLEERDERQRLGRVGRRRVLEHFTMQHIAAQTVEIYKTIR